MRPYSVWGLFGLRESPFFQDTLAPGTRYPTELFVGRERETDLILRGVGGTRSSRQVIHGDPGVGKTTLAQHVKELLAETGYLVRWQPVSVVAEGGSTGVIVTLLASAHESLLAAYPETSGTEAMEAARGVVRAFRTTDMGGGINILGSGAQAQRQTQFVRPVPGALLHEAWRVFQQLVRLAEDQGTEGLIVHLNNLENLVEEENIKQAALILRDLRDVFLTPSVHWLVVGSSDATHGAVGHFQQVRSIFLPSHSALEPLAGDEFIKLLHARYSHLTDAEADLVLPIEDGAARSIYRLFHGDLRGALHTLEQACITLAGIAEGTPIRPLRYEEIAGALQPIYAREIVEETSSSMVDRLVELGTLSTEGVTQTDLMNAWNVSRSRVSRVLGKLEARGFVRRIGKEGRSELWGLTGQGLIGLGMDGAEE